MRQRATCKKTHPPHQNETITVFWVGRIYLYGVAFPLSVLWWKSQRWPWGDECPSFRFSSCWHGEEAANTLFLSVTQSLCPCTLGVCLYLCVCVCVLWLYTDTWCVGGWEIHACLSVGVRIKMCLHAEDSLWRHLHVPASLCACEGS